jgi:SH3-like domain-containing protein
MTHGNRVAWREHMKKAFWIAMVLLFIGVPSGDAKTVSIAHDKVSVRAKPGKRTRVLFSAPKGYPILVRKRQHNWLYVEDWHGHRGWVYKNVVSAIPTTIIQADTANVRKGPSRKNSPVAQVQHGQIYKVLATRGDWVKIGYYYENEPIGWIHDKLIWGY